MDTKWRTPLMSEYQRYEFMTIERPLTGEQLDAVNALSSHIEASSTHAMIEYHWGDFKHDPIDVLHKFFDGFLYWLTGARPDWHSVFRMGSCQAISSMATISMISSPSPSTGIMISSISTLARWKRPTNGLTMNWDRSSPFAMS